VASLSQGRTAAAQCGLFTYKSVPVIFEPPCINTGVYCVGLRQVRLKWLTTDIYRHNVILWHYVAGRWKKKIESYQDIFVEHEKHRSDEPKRPGRFISSPSLLVLSDLVFPSIAANFWDSKDP